MASLSSRRLFWEIKVRIPNKIIRGMQIYKAYRLKEPRFEFLKAAVIKSFSISPPLRSEAQGPKWDQNFDLSYIDDDGDTIEVWDDDDLLIGLGFADTHKHILKLEISLHASSGRTPSDRSSQNVLSVPLASERPTPSLRAQSYARIPSGQRRSGDPKDITRKKDDTAGTSSVSEAKDVLTSSHRNDLSSGRRLLPLSHGPYFVRSKFLRDCFRYDTLRSKVVQSYVLPHPSWPKYLPPSSAPGILVAPKNPEPTEVRGNPTAPVMLYPEGAKAAQPIDRRIEDTPIKGNDRPNEVRGSSTISYLDSTANDPLKDYSETIDALHFASGKSRDVVKVLFAKHNGDKDKTLQELMAF